ncbi:MAG: 1,4-dihydroxy-2-naphthoate polyprenyltransferase [Deltaproteobacteria bacterium]|nr:1,4-dihydroxy-2-naphthoate polyprenyltransferase [Deltaproteobacteria bacterium]
MQTSSETQLAGLPTAGSVDAWLQAMRPRTLPAAAVPVVVGSALCFVLGGLHLGAALAALFGALCIQVGTNFANDVFDAEKGADGPERKGPRRMVAAGVITPGAMRAGIGVAFGLATLAGLYLVSVAGWPVIAIGVASLLAGLAYTGGPFPLAYNALGDLFVLIFFGGVAVGGTVFVQLGTLPPTTWPLALGVGALSTALLVVNNLRDVDEDRGNGKNTLAVLLGRRGALLEHALLLTLAYGAAGTLIDLDLPLTFIALGTAPVAARRHLRLRRVETGPEFNAELAATGKLLTLYGLSLAAALIAPML